MWGERQLELVQAIGAPPGEHSLVLAHGPVQCGKTHAACTAFFGWVALHWEGQDIGLSAPTWGQLEAQVMPYAQAVGDVMGGWGRKGPTSVGDAVVHRQAEQILARGRRRREG